MKPQPDVLLSVSAILRAGNERAVVAAFPLLARKVYEKSVCGTAMGQRKSGVEVMDVNR